MQRFYTQLVVWTYIVLPAICILLSPTLLLGVAKAQHQRAKLMANALAAKSKMAAAVARNNAKLYQQRLAPNHNVYNGHNFFPSAYPQQHRFRNIRDASVRTILCNLVSYKYASFLLKFQITLFLNIWILRFLIFVSFEILT